VVCYIANRICLCYAAIIPSEMFALPDKGKAQEEVKVTTYGLPSPTCSL